MEQCQADMRDNGRFLATRRPTADATMKRA